MINIKNGTKIFENNTVFSNLSVSFDGTGVVAITGESGVGKTTLLNIISGLDTLSSGELVNTYKDISYKFQTPNLIKWLTALENVETVLPSSRKDEALKWLAKVNLADSTDKLPHELSGGMAQRVAFARAMAYEGDLLLLDEPFNGIDEDNKQVMLDLIREASKERLVIIVTHNKDDISALDAKTIKIGKEA